MLHRTVLVIIFYNFFVYSLQVIHNPCRYSLISLAIQMSQHLNDEKAHPRWDEMWTKVEPGTYFDMLVASPALLKFIHEGKIPSGRALVPGMGRGYDVNALALDKTRKVIGIDLSEIAVNAATSWYNSLSDEQKAPFTNVDFIKGNFFELSTAEAEKFDFIYDYTFFCALSPTIRGDWAKQMGNLLVSGGILMTLIFPIRPADDYGPPFAVSLDIYRDLLESNGFECLELDMLPSELCHPGRDGRGSTGWSSGVGLWRRK
jgi:methyl halide transferase